MAGTHTITITDTVNNVTVTDTTQVVEVKVKHGVTLSYSSIGTLTEKTNPHNDDIMLIEDSQASYAQKKLTLKNLLNAGTFT